MTEQKETRSEERTIGEGTNKPAEERRDMKKSTRSIGMKRRTGLLVAAMATALVLGSGAALAETNANKTVTNADTECSGSDARNTNGRESS